MAEVDLFEKLTLSQIARWLDIHPFEIARVLGHEGGLPAQLHFDESEVDRVRTLTCVETWWDGGPLPVNDANRRRALIRSLAWKLLRLPEGGTARADNLARGLEGDELVLMRRAVNQLIRDGALQGISTARGLEVGVATSHRAMLQSVADGRDIPETLEALWA